MQLQAQLSCSLIQSISYDGYFAVVMQKVN